MTNGSDGDLRLKYSFCEVTVARDKAVPQGASSERGGIASLVKE